jgi:hypothetical protein
MSAANELQRAIHAALAGNQAVEALLGNGGVFDGLADGPVFPAIVFGAVQSVDWSTATEAGEEHRLILEVWSRENGKREVQAIMAAVKDTLHDLPLAMTGHHLVNLRLERTSAEREARSRRHRGTMRFRAVTEEI